jgi:hypothetical protein
MTISKIFIYTTLFLLASIVNVSCMYFQREKSGIAYYLDAENGNDMNKGTTPDQAWQTLERALTVYLNPGDSLLLRGGDTFWGFISLDSLKGTPDKPITISSYGDDKARIESGNTIAIYISNSSYVDVNNLVLNGSGRKEGNTNNGIEFENVQYGSISNLEVSGYLYSGVKITGGSDISITHVYAHNNGFSGIFVKPKTFLSEEDKPIRNLYIAYCKAENNPGCPVVMDNHSGNGILVSGVTNGIIEYCEALYNGWDMPRSGNGPVGIWAYRSDSLVIQHCYAHQNMTSENGHDGGGFDFDGGVTNSIMQYNLSAFNEGAGYGMYQYREAPVWENNIVRYNVSYFDGKKNGKSGIHMWVHPENPNLPIKGLHAYNNTIVNTAGHGINFERGHYDDFLFENNLILLTGKARQFIGGRFTGAVFNNNLYWSEAPTSRSRPPFAIAIDSQMIQQDPLLILPNDSDILDELSPEFLKTIDYFKLKEGSPAIGAGKRISNPGNTDFWGNPLLPNKPVNVGAYQGKGN